MRKILIINTTFFGGGAAAVARGLFVRFEKGHDLKMYFAYGRGQKYRGENIFYFGNILFTYY